MKTYLMKTSLFSATLLVASFVSAATSFAQIITVANFSFQLPDVSVPGFNSGGNGNTTAIQDWTITTAFGTAGVQAITSPLGTQSAYAGSPGGFTAVTSTSSLASIIDNTI